MNDDETGAKVREVLQAMDDLEPPTDELFVQRAVTRGRARAHRRRGVAYGAAAGVALVSVVGGVWLTGGYDRDVATSGAAPQHQEGASGGAFEDSGGLPTEPLEPAAGPQVTGSPTGTPGYLVPSVPSARDASAWFDGPASLQTGAFEALAPELTTRYAAVFGGAYGTDAANTDIVVTVTSRDAEFERFVQGAMPDPSDVSFRVVKHTWQEKVAAADSIRQDAAALGRQGVTVQSIVVDSASDRVVVTIAEAAAVPKLANRWPSDLVMLRAGTPAATLPGGATIPPPMR